MKQSPGSQPAQQPMSLLSPLARFNTAYLTSWAGWWILADGIAHPALGLLVLGIALVVVWKFRL